MYEHQAQKLVQEFFRITREREGAALAAWQTRVDASGIPSLRSFTQRLGRDSEAAVVGLTLPWSSGSVEGQVNQTNHLWEWSCPREPP